MDKTKKIVQHFLISEILLAIGIVLYGVFCTTTPLVLLLFWLVTLFFYYSTINVVISIIDVVISYAVPNLKSKIPLLIYIIILGFILKFSWFLWSHTSEYENYENWQYYNHQALTSKNLDLLIAKNYTEFLAIFLLIAIHLLIFIFEKSKSK